MLKRIMILLVPFFMFMGVANAASVGRAVSVSGDVWVLVAKNKVKLEKGDALNRYETIITGKKGRVRLLMSDNSRVYLSPRSRLKLSEYKVKKGSLIGASFKMLWGKVRFLVHKLPYKSSFFRVKTRTAVLGVRGTEFLTSVDMPAGINPADPNLTMEQLPPLPTSVDMSEGVVVLTDNKGGNHQLTKGTSTTVDNNGNISQSTTSDGQSSDSPASEGDVSEGDASAPAASEEAGSANATTTQMANQVANTAGVGSSTIQGSTITTPYQYRFGGK